MYYSPSRGGFYTPEIHGDLFIERIVVDDEGIKTDRYFDPDPDGPIADAVEITTAEHAALMQAQAAGKRIVFDEGLGVPVAADQPLPTAAAAITMKLASINASCESEIAAISAGYPASEVQSWPKQEAEARAWPADNQAVTPLLDSLAAARGINKAELAGRVIAKADLFAQLSGAIIGKRQALEEQLDAISDGLTAEELEAPITPEVQALLDDIKWDAEL